MKFKPQSLCRKILEMPYLSLLFEIFPKVFTLICFPCYKCMLASAVGYRFRIREAEMTRCPWSSRPSCIRGMAPRLFCTRIQGHPLRLQPPTSTCESCRANPSQTVKCTGRGLQNHNLALYLLPSDYTNYILG